VRLSAVRERSESREASLSPWALRSADAKRAFAEPECDLRTAYQRDRDRIIHSAEFRRLKHKSQVLIAPRGDHYTTRLTHVVEVAQVGRTLARALNLNEDLVEAAALGHDLGHTPFGHVGERVLDELLEGGFHHSRHSVRIVERLARDGRGMNLTLDVVDAIRRHSKPQGAFMSRDAVAGMSLEAQIVRLSDAIAYLAHDIQDALRTGLLTQSDFPADVLELIGTRHSQRINNILRDVVANSGDCAARVDGAAAPWIRVSAGMEQALTALRDFMFERFYLRVSAMAASVRAQAVMRLLFEHLRANPTEVPAARIAAAGADARQAAVDYLCGMTDNYALAFAERLEPGSTDGVAFTFV